MTFKDTLRHAFAVEPDEGEFTPADTALLDKIVRAVVKRQMTAPALMFLESVRPLNFLGSQAMLFFQPIVSMVISTTEYERFSAILEKRKSIPLLIDMLEKEEEKLRSPAVQQTRSPGDQQLGSPTVKRGKE